MWNWFYVVWLIILQILTSLVSFFFYTLPHPLCFPLSYSYSGIDSVLSCAIITNRGPLPSSDQLSSLVKFTLKSCQCPAVTRLLVFFQVCSTMSTNTPRMWWISVWMPPATSGEGIAKKCVYKMQIQSFQSKLNPHLFSQAEGGYRKQQFILSGSTLKSGHTSRELFF